MLIAVIASFFTSLLVALVLIRYLHLHQHLSGDSATDGPQKFHVGLTPRIGGIPILAGWVAGMTVVGLQGLLPFAASLLWFAAMMPVFLAGVTEDLTKKIAPRWRLLASFISAGCGIWLLGAVLPRVALPGIDVLLSSVPVVAWVITVVAVGGLCHSINLIDGYNGLAGGVALMILVALGYVCFKVGDSELLIVCAVGVGAVLGFLAWNYPRGLIFAGDGGAYLLGFIIAEVSVLLVARHPQVSPWFPLTLVMYPVWETLFTIYRRKLIQGQSAGLPDALHLHQMVFNRLVRWMVGKREAKQLIRRNAMTTPYLWGVGLLTILPAVLSWQRTWVLQIICSVFIVSYIWFYRCLVRFKAPKWLMVRKS